MTRVKWNEEGSRFFESGVDRGVLYVGSQPGAPWDGLVAVEESTTGGEPTGYYFDGDRYATRQGAQEFELSIEAYTYPSEFNACLGTVDLANGLLVTQQRRQEFSFVYRTGIGNDTVGANHAYKLHLVYGALVTPSSRNNTTISETLEAENFSWSVTTKAPKVPGYRNSPHLMLDSRDVDPGLLAQLEDILYGDTNAEARMPSIDELIFIFESFNALGFDGGDNPLEVQYASFDGGSPSSTHTTTIDGGAA